MALLQHEKVDLLKRLEEDQEDLNELMKKHKALIAQVLQLLFTHPDLNQISGSLCVCFSPPVTSLRSESFRLSWRR